MATVTPVIRNSLDHVIKRKLEEVEKKQRLHYENFLPKQMGDVSTTFADVAKARQAFGYNPKTRIKDGIPKFVDWYREHYKI